MLKNLTYAYVAEALYFKKFKANKKKQNISHMFQYIYFRFYNIQYAYD